MKDELDEYGFPRFEQNSFPLAYLIPFRTYGTWLHGDARTSVRRIGNNRFRGPRVTASVPLSKLMRENQKSETFILDVEQRKCVDAAIKDVCEFRNYLLRALNLRTNHAHAVVSANLKPEIIVNDFKVYATRRLRSERLIDSEEKVWSRGASTRYLWKPKHVNGAVDYVKYCQEDVPFEFRD